MVAGPSRERGTGKVLLDNALNGEAETFAQAPAKAPELVKNPRLGEPS